MEATNMWTTMQGIIKKVQAVLRQASGVGQERDRRTPTLEACLPLSNKILGYQIAQTEVVLPRYPPREVNSVTALDLPQPVISTTTTTILRMNGEICMHDKTRNTHCRVLLLPAIRRIPRMALSSRTHPKRAITVNLCTSTKSPSCHPNRNMWRWIVKWWEF